MNITIKLSAEEISEIVMAHFKHLLYTWKTLKEMNLEWVILLPTVPLLLVFLFDWCEKTIDEGKKHNL